MSIEEEAGNSPASFTAYWKESVQDTMCKFVCILAFQRSYGERQSNHICKEFSAD